MGVFDALSQWLVGAPIVVQMLVVLVTAAPTLVIVAWIVMWVIDHVANAMSFLPRVSFRRSSSRMTSEEGDSKVKIVDHVEPR